MKYDELMDKIEVTDAMRARILRNVSAAAPKKTPVRRYALLVACLAVVLLGAVCVPKLMDPAPQGEQVAIANGMIEVADAAALADAVGFPAAEAAERYTLAVWTDGQYTYSLRLSDGQSTEVWQRLLAGVRTEG